LERKAMVKNQGLLVGHRPGGHAFFNGSFWNNCLREEDSVSSEKEDWSDLWSRRRDWLELLENVVPLPDRRSRAQNSLADAERRTTPDRRSAPRYPAWKNQAQLGWWESQGFRTALAQLVNISQSGALVLTKTRPPENATIAIYLDGPVPTNWVEATIVDIASNSDELYQIRMKFTERCPFEVFKVAVGGFHVTNSDDGQ
jgi:hypothetical protein